MNSDSIPTGGKSFIAIVLISVSLIIFFLWQWKIIAQNRDAVTTNRAKLDEFVSKNMSNLDAQVAKADQLETGVQKLVMGLLDLSKTDTAAKAIINKYNVQQQAPPAATSPAPSASPAKQ